METLGRRQHRVRRTQRAAHMVEKQFFYFMQTAGPNIHRSSIYFRVCSIRRENDGVRPRSWKPSNTKAPQATDTTAHLRVCVC